MLLHGLSEPEFSGDLVLKLMQIVGNPNLSVDIKGYNVDIMRQNACLVVNPINVATLFVTKTRIFKYIENFTTKNWKFSDKTSYIFHIYVENIDCGYSLEPPRRGGFNEYPQSMFFSRNKKNNVYPCKPQFYYIKVEFKGVKII